MTPAVLEYAGRTAQNLSSSVSDLVDIVTRHGTLDDTLQLSHICSTLIARLSALQQDVLIHADTLTQTGDDLWI